MKVLVHILTASHPQYRLGSSLQDKVFIFHLSEDFWRKVHIMAIVHVLLQALRVSQMGATFFRWTDNLGDG